MMNLTGKRAVIYGRFSSDMQREESLEAQERACRKFAEDNGIEVVDKYYDRAKSGRDAGREHFRRMIEDSADGGFDLLLVDKVDRFARNRREATNIRYDLRRNNVIVISVKQPYDPDKPEGVIMESIYDGMAEYYSRNLAQEVEKGKRENAYKGRHIGGKPPLGYDIDRDTKKLVVNPREAQAVRMIFAMYLDGHSYAEIADRLNLDGYRTKLYKYRNKMAKSGLWAARCLSPTLCTTFCAMRSTPGHTFTRAPNQKTLTASGAAAGLLMMKTSSGLRMVARRLSAGRILKRCKSVCNSAKSASPVAIAQSASIC